MTNEQIQAEAEKRFPDNHDAYQTVFTQGAQYHRDNTQSDAVEFHVWARAYDPHHMQDPTNLYELFKAERNG